ncbi:MULTISPECIES: YlxQ family RNA-binding protein [Ureibacillus]|jgi:ribosomal protein L7Ae-like RNA K-turn-binding protein|uniref:Ribosomal protein L7Ae-like RNA K-turn-binding protein n=1 Tax=Ureibacillus thermosphaericus TaxID=51173 RepID=A0A840PRQ9_URETH|nr:YlxQ family RNA-binding protein [Ureibacillus thermosphaericus]MBB5147834.1 ribosomal protein L7Ae-like RNA K-turn-binding protein [Ureibacillus thermosphaericus]NKZ30364.1 YlxQ family RNA-binding protein [Ureibacillus thermosphaericus]
MNHEKIFQMLGLATRARKIITGEELVVKEIQKGNAKLVILASDAAYNSRKKIQDKCTFYNVEYHIFGNRYELGHAIGKEARVVIAITDQGFAKKLSSLLNEN